MLIEDLVFNLSKKPFDANLNFVVAVEYERINQTASAVSFYLRAVEFSEKENDPVVYASLLKMAHCFDDQKDRKKTVSNCLLQAIAYWPERPEAYFLLAQFHDRLSQWQECYTYAEIGLHLATFPNLPVDIGYYGSYCLEFEKAVSAYWIGRKDESKTLLSKLASMNIANQYKVAVLNNLERIKENNGLN
jgi:hypothetical protein